jgi:hypothetical protein
MLVSSDLAVEVYMQHGAAVSGLGSGRGTQRAPPLLVPTLTARACAAPHLAIGHAPNGGAHGQQVVAAEGVAVPVLLQVGRQRLVARRRRVAGLQDLQ